MTIFNTRGIVLRTVKYGDTSIITTIFTELFGIKTYIVNGARSGKKTSKAHLFQPASLLEMQVYNNELKNLQRIKESKWSTIYKGIYADVVKNTVALYMVELLLKTLKQPEANDELFGFCENAFIALDSASNTVTANYALYFTLHLPSYLGFQISSNHSSQNNIFDVREGKFTNGYHLPAEYANVEQSEILAQFLSIHQPADLENKKLTGKKRVELLTIMYGFYKWHIPEMGSMKTPAILSEIL